MMQVLCQTFSCDGRRNPAGASVSAGFATPSPDDTSAQHHDSLRRPCTPITQLHRIARYRFICHAQILYFIIVSSGLQAGWLCCRCRCRYFEFQTFRAFSCTRPCLCHYFSPQITPCLLQSLCWLSLCLQLRCWARRTASFYRVTRPPLFPTCTPCLTRPSRASVCLTMRASI